MSEQKMPVALWGDVIFSVLDRYHPNEIANKVTDSFKNELISALPKARKYARTLVRDMVDADDLVHDAIERALKKSDSFEIGTNIHAWLNRIIKNVFLDEQKSHRVSKTTLVGDNEAGVMEKNFSARSSGDLEIEVTEVQDFLYTMPENERSVVMLWAEGYSYEEIASELDITRSHAGVILCRARKALHEQFRR